MDLKLEKRTSLFHHCSSIFILGSLTFVILYFWKTGFFDLDRFKKISMIEERLESHEKSKIFHTINSQFRKSKFSELGKNILEIESNSNQASNILGISFSDEYRKSFEFNDEVQNFSAKHSPQKIIRVAELKVDRFSTYVQFNKWPTLIRNTRNLLALIRNPKFLNSTDSNLKKWEKIIEHMRTVTNRSVLKDHFKAAINERLDSLMIENNLLVRYSNAKQKLNKSFDSFQKTVQSEYETILPKVLLQKIKMEKQGNYFLMSLIGIAGALGLFLLLGMVVDKFMQKNYVKSTESFIKSIVDNIIIKQNKINSSEFSKEFNRFLRITSEYINKRMNFSSIFQNALPFSTLILDSNLKSVWANSNFVELFHIQESEIYNNHLTWDFVSKMTDIDDNDPIYEAVKSNMGGIFQIKVKNASGVNSPFEMYVSPYEKKKEKFVMILFYPLSNLEETIKDQANAIIKPIEQVIDLLQFDQMDEDRFKRYKNIFQIASIGGIFKKLIKLNSSYLTQIYQLSKSVDEISMINEENKSKLKDIKSYSKKGGEGFFAQAKNFSEVKVVFNKHKSISNQSLNKVEQMVKIFKELTESIQDEIQYSDSLLTINEEIFNNIPSFDYLRDESKVLRSELSDVRHKMGHSLSQIIHLKKRIKDQQVLDKVEDYYRRVSNDYESLSRVTEVIDKKGQNFEVQLSKLQMIFSVANDKSLVLKSGKSNRSHFVQLNDKLGELYHETVNLSKLSHQTNSQMNNLIVDLQKISKVEGDSFNSIDQIVTGAP